MLILHKKIQFYNILHQFRLNAKLLQRCCYIRHIATLPLQKKLLQHKCSDKTHHANGKKTTKKRQQWNWQQTNQNMVTKQH